MTRIAAITASAAVVALLAGMGVAVWMNRSDDNAFAQCGGAAISGGMGAVGGPFELVNAAGETVTDADEITEPSLIYFGYTFCPDVCPLDMSRNAEAIDVLTERGRSVTPVFITIDPARDTPEVVGDFAENLHEKMIGLTGSDAQVKAATQAYRAYARKHGDDPEYYLMDHSTFTYLVLPEHGVVDFFRNDLSAEQIADRTQCYVDNI